MLQKQKECNMNELNLMTLRADVSSVRCEIKRLLQNICNVNNQFNGVRTGRPHE